MKWAVKVMLAILTYATMPAMAQADTELQQELLMRIDNSRKALERIEKSISDERLSIGRQLQTREAAITELRERAETVQRRRDERLLGLDQLVSRLEQWQRQNSYQMHILRSYADEFSTVAVDSDESENNPQQVVNLLETSLDRLNKYMNPEWQALEVVATDGAMVTLDVLMLGPITLAMNDQNDQGYLLDKDIHGKLSVAKVLGGAQLKQAQLLRQTGTGGVTLDPTLGNAARIAGSDESILTHVGKGGMWAVPIIFFGVISLIISIIKAIQLIRMPRVNPYLAQHIDKIVHLKDERSAQSLRKLASSVEGPQRRLIEI
ncbi:MAG TPA: hypothetical protein VIC08_12175, partial [Cellvibrionaceae bacterium]